jgi:hypothetical protein
VRQKLRIGWLFAVASTLGTAACPGGFNLPLEPDDAGTDAGIPHEAAPPPDVSAPTDGPGAASEANDSNAVGDVTDPRCAACAAYGAVTSLGPIPPVLPELSGLAASVTHPGILYAHNDSGDTARFFALNQAAAVQAEFDLVGAVATDWEDIEVGPCTPAGGPQAVPSNTAGSCVYLGDIGDNDLKRTQYAVYRVAEPDPVPSDGSAVPVTFERFPFVFPDGSHNSETLLVHRATGRIFVVTKVNGIQGTVYELPQPLQPDTMVTMVKVMDVSLPALAGAITGGSFHPCSNRLLLRTYFALYELSDLLDTRPEALFAAAPVQVPVATEVKGEAVTYAEDGRGYFTASETPPNSTVSQLSFVSCP